MNSQELEHSCHLLTEAVSKLSEKIIQIKLMKT